MTNPMEHLQGSPINVNGVKLKSLRLELTLDTEAVKAENPDQVISEEVWLLMLETEVDIPDQERYLKSGVLLPGNKVGPSGALTMHELQALVNGMMLQLAYTDKYGKPFQPSTDTTQ